MAGSVSNKYLSGSNGQVWLDGEEVGELTGIDSKITFNLEEVKTCGKQSTDYMNTGWSGEGTLKLQKTQSRGLTLMAEAMSTGIIPEVTIITKLIDKQTLKAERTSLIVMFTEFNPVKFEGQGNVEEEIPFKILDMKILEVI